MKGREGRKENHFAQSKLRRCLDLLAFYFLDLCIGN
jgi:hypothetical protein